VANVIITNFILVNFEAVTYLCFAFLTTPSVFTFVDGDGGQVVYGNWD